MISWKTIQTRIRLFANRNKEPYIVWKNILGFYPNDLSLYETAITHSSTQIPSSTGGWMSNERLEFLGDSIIGAVAADLVFHEFPRHPEGYLTKTRSKVVCRNHLNEVCYTIGLAPMLRLSAGIKANARNVYGNAVEALVGAIYLDQGYDVAFDFVMRNIAVQGLKNWQAMAQSVVDYKSKLLEWGQHEKKVIEFVLQKSDFDRSQDVHSFWVDVLVDGEVAGQGMGPSKREAQQNAAKSAYIRLKDVK